MIRKLNSNPWEPEQHVPPDVTLRYTENPEHETTVDIPRRVIYLRAGMPKSHERSELAYALARLEIGNGASTSVVRALDDREAWRRAAERLISIEHLGEVMRFRSGAGVEAWAADLAVSPQMVEVRLADIRRNSDDYAELRSIVERSCPAP